MSPQRGRRRRQHRAGNAHGQGERHEEDLSFVLYSVAKEAGLVE
jgi:hypothetical protein